MMKKFLSATGLIPQKAGLFFALLFSSFVSFSQCAYNNTSAGSLTPTCPGTVNSSNINGGQYLAISVVSGNTYTFSTCGNTSCDSQLSLYNSSGSTSYAFNDDGCSLQSTITWTATFTGTVHLLLDAYNCTSGCNGTPITVTCSAPISNDNPCGAISLPVNGSCSYSTYTTVGATSTSGPPSPSCANYAGGDVWFSITVPASGNITLNSNTGGITDGGMALYTASSCSGSFTQVSCDDDASSNGLMPMISSSGLTPGSTVYVRFWEYGNDNPGTFQICASDAGGGGGACVGGSNNSCTTADPFCTGTAYNYCNSTGVASMGTFGCLLTTPNPMWMYLQISTSGNISIYMEQFTTGGSPIDVDYALYGPYSSLAAACPITGATPTISCSYSTAATETGNITGAIAGQWYMLLITNFNGSAGYIQFSQTGGSGATNCNIVTPCPVTAGSNSPLCAGQTLNLTATNVAGATYSWSGPGGYTSSSQNPTRTNVNTAMAGTYTVTVTAPGPCTSTSSVTVTINALPSVSVTPSAITVCSGYSTTLTASGANTYTWSPSTGLSATTGTSVTATPTSTQTYTVTGTNTSTGCTNTATTTITVNPPLSISVTPSAPSICSGSSVSLTASGATTYSWSPSGGLSATTGATVTANPGSTTTYTVTGSSTNCNPASTTVTVTVNSTASGFTYNGNQCLTGNSFSFSNTGAMGAATYSWSFPSGSPSTSTAQNPGPITWSSAGTYTVSQTVTANGCSSTSTQNITVYGLPAVSASGTNPLCNGGCTGTVSASGSGGTPGYTYSWSGGLGTGTPKSSVCAGTYNVTVSDANGCTGTNSVTINNPSALSGSASATNASCNGVCSGTLSASGSGGTSPYSYSWNSGLGTGATKSSVCAGTYSVTITDANGCTNVQSATVNQPAALSASASATNASCSGGCNGTLSVSASGGTTNYTYNWSGGLGSGATKSGVCTGSYTVTVTDANGCTTTASTSVSAPSALVPSATGTNVSCNGGNNGSASVSVSGGTTGYTYLWSSGSTSSSATGLNAGTFTVTVTDANSCTATASVTITQPAALTVTATATAASCNGSTNGSATANPSGGTSPYTYLWSGNFQTTQTATGLAAGTYTVTITGVGGCTTTASATVNQPTAISGTTTSTNSTCGSATGTATVTASGGTSPYAYSWSTSPTQTSATATGLMAGSYTVTVTDANSCTNTATASISSAGAPTASISSSTNVNCFGGNNGTATVTASGGATPYTYAWSPSGGNAATANGLTAGTYCVNVTDNNNCVTSACTTINEPTQLAGTPTSVSNTTCNGVCSGSATVSISGGVSPYTYLWQGGGTSATKTGLCAETSSVTVTDANGCGIVVSVTITEPTALSGTATGTSVSCNGICDGDGNLTPSGGTSPYTFSWDNGETSEDATSLCAGSHTVTITDANGCTATTTVTINTPAALSLSPSSTNSACGQSNGSACISVSGGTTNYTYSWSTSPAQTSSCATGVSAGNYTVTVTDANGCISTNTVTVNNSSGGTASATMNSNATGAGLCNGSATASMTGGTSPYTYLWGNGQTSTTSTGLCAGSNCVTVTDANGCSDVACVTITEPSAISAVAVPASVQCSGDCDGTIDLSVSGGVSPYTYNWSNGATAEDISNLCAGNFNVTVTDANGISTTATATISSPSAINISPTANNIVCNGVCNGTISLLVTGGTEPYAYLWSNGLTTANANSLCTGNYSVTITDNFGCTGTTTAAITEPAAMNLTFTSANANCGANDGSATVSVSGGTPQYGFSWSAGSATNSQTGIAAGTYTVTITDANNCTQTGNVVVNNNSAGTPSATVDSNVSCNGGNNGQATASITGGTPPYTYKWSTSPMQTTPTATGLTAGTYSVTITDASCPVVVSVTVTEPAALTVNSSSATSAGCFGSCNGITTINSSGGTSPYSFQWNDLNLQTSQTATGLCAGNFSVTVSDVSGCTITSSTTVTQNQDIVLNTSSTQSTCNQSDASASVSIASGVSPFTYQWDANAGNQTTATATGLSANCYDVTVTDGNSCTKVVNICVTDAGAPSVSVLTQTDISCNSGCDGFAQISVSGGNPPYNYSWNTSPVQTTASAFNLCAGTYTGSMVDATGCTASVSVTIAQPNSLNITISSLTNASCAGSCNGLATAIVSGGTSPYTYLWNDPSATATATAASLCSGTFTVQISDANSCDTSISVIISEPSVLSVSATSTSAFCGTASGSACATASGGTSPYNYLWNDASSQNTSCANNILPGNYSATITDANNCTVTASTTVGNVPSGSATVSGAVNVSCNGGSDGSASVSIGGSGTSPYSYLWNNGVETQNIASLPAGNYTVTITDANGCTATATAIINSPAAMSISSQAILDASCFGQCNGNATIDAAGGTLPYSYLWNDPLSQTGKSATGLCAGNYSVTISDANGCSISQNVTVGEPSQLNLSATSTNANCNQNNGAAFITSSGGTSPYSYLWPNGNINAFATSIAAGTYVVTITDGNNCSGTVSANVQNLNGPTATVTSTNVDCNGNCNGSATASVSGGVFPYNFQWDANANNQVAPTASNLCGGMYVVTITDSAGCAVSISATINEPAAISYNQQSVNPTCFNGSNGTAFVTVSGGTTPYSYQWNNGNTTSSIMGLSAGNYSLTISDANNCTVLLNYTLMNPAQITTSTSPVAVSCNNSCDGKATVTASNGNTPYTYLWNNGQTSQQANGLCAGNYSVTVTDNNGCTATSAAIISQPSAITASINNFGNVSCTGQCNGYAQVSVGGGIPAYTYSWSNGSVSQVNSNLCAGNYTVTVTDANSCTKIATVNIIQPQAFSSSITGTNVACGGICNGQAALSPSGGATPYSYLWSASANFQTGQTATALCGGNYSVTITDSAGCQIYKSVFIFEPTPLGLVVNTKADAHCQQNDGNICINAVGGSAPYTYQWNDPNTQTSSCATALYAGCYIMNITDAQGCSVDTLVCLNDIAGPAMAIDSVSNVICNGSSNGRIDFNVSGGTPSYNILWIDNFGDTLTQYTGLTVSGFTLSGGTYTLLVTDAAGCVSTLSQTIIEPNPMASAVTNVVDVSCNGVCSGSATIGVAGGTMPYSYNWLNGQTSSSATGLCAGVFTVTITDVNGCSKTQVGQITEPPPLTVSSTSNNVSCNGNCDGAILINASGGNTSQPYFYNWNPNSAGNFASAYNLCAGTFSTTVTDNNNCTAIQVTTLNEPQPMNLTSVITGSTCSVCNGSATLTGTGGTSPYIYFWGTGPVSPSVQNLCAGNNYVTVTDAKGCLFIDTLIIPDAPGLQISGFTVTQPLCNGGTDGSATVNFTGGTSAFSYIWSSGSTNQSAGNLSAGTYNVVLTDANACTATQPVTITQPLPLIPVGDPQSDSICYGQSIQIWASAQGGTAPYAIQWTGNSSNLTGTTAVVNPLATTIYTFTVIDSNNCVNTNGQIQVDVTPPLVVTILPQGDTISICNGESDSLCASGQGGGLSPYNYQWSNNISDSCQTVNAQTASPLSVVLSDGCSLNDTDLIVVNINQNPVISFTTADTAFCPPQSIDFNPSITPVGLNVTYQWTFEGGNPSSSDLQNPSVNYEDSGNYDVTLVVTTPEGCSDDTTYANYLTVYPTPFASFTAEPLVESILTPEIDFNAVATTGADSAIQWDMGDNSAETEILFTHHYSDTGTYNVILTAINKYECKATDTAIVVIKDGFVVFAPNAFTPNNDGKNDFFFPKGVGINPDKFKMWIFDRWGDIIFETNNINSPWDGTAHGGSKPVQIGVYIWMVETEDNEGDPHKLIGTVAVVR